MKTTYPAIPSVLSDLCVSQMATQVAVKQTIMDRLRTISFSPFEAKVESDWVLAQRSGVLPFVPTEITEIPAWPAEKTHNARYAETLGSPCLFSMDDVETRWSDHVFYCVIAYCMHFIPEASRPSVWRNRIEMHAFETTLTLGIMEEARRYGFFSAHALYCTMRTSCVSSPALYAFWAAVMDLGLDFIDPEAYPILAHFEREKTAWNTILKIRSQNLNPLVTMPTPNQKQEVPHAHS
jgi:hypothetical protein